MKAGLTPGISGKEMASLIAGIAPIIAHRGASHDAPENTIAAFSMAWQQGADGIEGDFRLSKDGKIFCMHDATTLRTTGKDLAIAETTSAELRKLDAGAWKGKQWEGEKIPLIDEVLATVPEGKKIYMEIKCGPEIFPAIRKPLESSGLENEQVVIISFDGKIIAESKRQFPRLKALLLTAFKEDAATGLIKPTPGEILSDLERIGADGTDCLAHKIVDRNFVEFFRSAGKEVHVWTVDELSETRRLLEAGVDALASNRAAWLKKQLRKRT